jgi:PAS domain S-box-containing protein
VARRSGDQGGGGRRPDGGPHGRAEPAGARRLAHELEVHQAELELQNELRAARGQIEAGLARYRELFDFAPVGYVVVREDGAIVEVNLAAARLLGLERGSLRGRPLASFVPRSDVEALQGLLADVRHDPGCGKACELAIVSQPSGILDVRATATALAGTPGAALVSLEDLTARHHAESALREESRRKDEFLASLSHELRNPLAPIRNGLELLARMPPANEQARRALAVVDRQVRHLGRIVDDLLDHTRIGRGQARLQRELADLGEIVGRAVEDHRAAFDAAGVALRAELPEATCWADVDATRIEQVLGNLLGNAVKFTPRGGRVLVALRRDGGRCAVTVTDSGTGIAPDVQGRLFQPFSQAAQTPDRRRGGLGLGLALVKALVELHGGAVEASSGGEGRGASFTVRLPLAAPPAPARDEERPRAAVRRRVLVIDDNEDAASTLKECLELLGHDAYVAGDGPSGLALARQLAPDVVVCDIGLPGMDGYAVARALRADEATRGAYLVALSGYALPEDLRRAHEAGFDRHLAKPLELDALQRVLRDESPASPHPEPQPSA